ncbi:MAG: energy-coupling factor transporter ATPase [Anaerolineales bacterium]|nr:energy-coupling factor transporter ATPase [Anaerolineales bacterium]
MIRVENLSISYGNERVIKDLSLQVNPGEWVLITGPSGCGKSTLAQALSGLIPHAISCQLEGSILVDGMNTQDASLDELACKVGLVFQNPSSQLFHLTVREEVAFGLRNLGKDEAEVQRLVSETLKTVGIAHLQEKRPDQLSGGQKQLVAVAAVLAMQPRILILDEPTASLDVSSTNQVIDALTRMKEEYGVTILMVEHRLQGAFPHLDQVYVMDQGRFAAWGSPDEVLENAAIRDQYGLRRPVNQPLNSWASLIEGNGRAAQRPGLPLLSLEKISAGYGRNIIIKDIDLTLYPGEFVSLVGDNGSGKSTLALTAAGLVKPRSGKIYFQGKKQPRPGLDVALLFQDPREQLFADTVDEEVAFASRNYGRFDPERHQKVLRETDLRLFVDRRPITLSLGQQLRTALAACVAIQPRLVILDEPTLGQDWGHLEQLMNYLRQLNEQGTAILLISHDYKLVHHYTDRVLLMEEGRITMRGSVS